MDMANKLFTFIYTMHALLSSAYGVSLPPRADVVVDMVESAGAVACRAR